MGTSKLRVGNLPGFLWTSLNNIGKLEKRSHFYNKAVSVTHELENFSFDVFWLKVCNKQDCDLGDLCCGHSSFTGNVL